MQWLFSWILGQKNQAHCTKKYKENEIIHIHSPPKFSWTVGRFIKWIVTREASAILPNYNIYLWVWLGGEPSLMAELLCTHQCVEDSRDPLPTLHWSKSSSWTGKVFSWDSRWCAGERTRGNLKIAFVNHNPSQICILTREYWSFTFLVFVLYFVLS